MIAFRQAAVLNAVAPASLTEINAGCGRNHRNMQKLVIRNLMAGVFAAGVLLVGSGCVSSGWADRSVATAGFRELPLGPGIYRIAYDGNAPLSSEQALDLALLRACELVNKQGLSHFAVIDESSSTPGQIVYRTDLNRFALQPDRGLVIKGFSSKPKSIFSFKARNLQRVLNDKLNLKQS